jgi:hypothetical protein
VRRTVKFLSAVSSGKHIVSLEWVAECKKKKCIVEDRKFLMHDKKAETTYKFSLEKSLESARAGLLCDGLRFFTSKNVVPGKSDLSEIVTAAGGIIF